MFVVNIIMDDLIQEHYNKYLDAVDVYRTKVETDTYAPADGARVSPASTKQLSDRDIPTDV